MHLVPLIIVMGYIILLFAVSWFSKSLAKRDGAEGYLLAGRNMPMILVAVNLAGLAIGGSSTIGVAQNAYTAGISAGWYNVAWAAGGILVGLTVAGRYRKMKIATIPELFEKYYSSAGRTIAVIGQLLVQITITSLQYVAGGAILTALLPGVFNPHTGMLTTAIVFVGITLIGGMWGVGLTHVVNVIVIYVGIIVGTLAGLSHFGGFQAIQMSLPAQGPWFKPLAGVGVMIVAAWFAVMITQAFSTQAIVQIAFSARNEKAARRGFVVGGLLIMPMGFLSAIMGIIAAAKFPGIVSSSALPKVVLSLNPIVAGITLSGLWAADVSSASGLLLGSSTLVIEDVWKRYFRPAISDKERMAASRIIVLAVSVITYLLATTVSGILNTLTIGLTLTSAYTVVLLFTMFVPGLCRRSSAFWTILTGILYLAVWEFVPATHIVPHPIYLAWPVAIATFLLVALADKRAARIPALLELVKTAE
ncbi:solute symporter family [Acididesulfobacillus acetoxydans]|uniref:Na+/solute symporter n=1 Tax=Acididesulfobacillus acetoxydans TaxID=1561005 RepID=A0A8S0XYG3_9FIRM|nr:sodium:solute symporter family protein [Acididesulfobacillus acetoxydans]CAA7602157.1 solute symporter family [Acididesulfobacillus acetoxydans]CEJ07999.1 Na+/solute symporter [Acididesulfobacillus acetoxydans]